MFPPSPSLARYPPVKSNLLTSTLVLQLLHETIKQTLNDLFFKQLWEERQQKCFPSLHLGHGTNCKSPFISSTVAPLDNLLKNNLTKECSCYLQNCSE